MKLVFRRIYLVSVGFSPTMSVEYLISNKSIMIQNFTVEVRRPWTFVGANFILRLENSPFQPRLVFLRFQTLFVEYLILSKSITCQSFTVSLLGPWWYVGGIFILVKLIDFSPEN